MPKRVTIPIHGDRCAPVGVGTVPAPGRKRDADADADAALAGGKTARRATIQYNSAMGATDASSSAHSEAGASPPRTDASRISALPHDMALLIMVRLPLRDLMSLLCAWRVGRLHAFRGADRLFKMRDAPKTFGIDAAPANFAADAQLLYAMLRGHICADRVSRAAGLDDYCTTAELYTRMLFANKQGVAAGTQRGTSHPAGRDIVARIEDVLSDMHEVRSRHQVTISAQMPDKALQVPLSSALLAAIAVPASLHSFYSGLFLAINNGTGIDAPTEFDIMRIKQARMAAHATALLRYNSAHWSHTDATVGYMVAHIVVTMRELARGAWRQFAPSALAAQVYEAWRQICPNFVECCMASLVLRRLEQTNHDKLAPRDVYAAKAVAAFYRSTVTKLRNSQAENVARKAAGPAGATQRVSLVRASYGIANASDSWIVQGMDVPKNIFNPNKKCGGGGNALDSTMMMLLHDADRAVLMAGVFPTQLCAPGAASWAPGAEGDRPPNAIYDENAWTRMLDTASYVIDWIVWRTDESAWCIRALLCALVSKELPAAALAVCCAARDRPLHHIVMDTCPTLGRRLHDVMTRGYRDPLAEDAALFNTIVPIVANMGCRAGNECVLMTWAALVQFELWVLATVSDCYCIDTDAEHWNVGQQQVARALVDVMRRLRNTPLDRAHVRLSADARRLQFAPAPV